MDSTIKLLKNLKESDIHKLRHKNSSDKNFKYLGKGAQGIVYKINDYAIKILNKKNFTGNEQNAVKLFKGKNVPNIINIYYVQYTGNYVIILMDFANGNLAQWIELPHSDCEWFSMLLQVIIGIFILQKEFGMFHADLVPKNILFKEFDAPRILECDLTKYFDTQLGASNYKVNTKYSFLIGDFGHSVTVNFPGRFTKKDVELFISSNADFYNLASLQKRIAINNVTHKFTLQQLIDKGKSDEHFLSYYETKKKDLDTKMAHYSDSIRNNLLYRAIAYYLVEKSLIGMEGKNLPSRKVIEKMDQLEKILIEDSINLIYDEIKKSCS